MATVRALFLVLALAPICCSGSRASDDGVALPRDALLVPGGTFDRGNDAGYPATVSDFRLDRYEVTVARFRSFVDAFDGWRGLGHPLAGAGAHPRIVTSGWNPSFDASLPASADRLRAAIQGETCRPHIVTWTDTPGGNELRPINCVTWYEASAFCAWEGGRLATEAEWNYAASGGAEQRIFPWGAAAPAQDAALAVYGCFFSGSSTCALEDIAEVGSVPAGEGKFGQADLAGSMREWTLDWFSDPYGPGECVDCANLTGGEYRVFRGGGWYNSETNLRNSIRNNNVPEVRSDSLGFRCARDAP